jgi:large subunit ribosomal protein L5
MAEGKAMREIKLEKVTLNIGCAGEKEKIERARKLLKMLTNKNGVLTVSKRRSTFGVPKGKPVGVKITLRGKEAENILRLALTGVENRLKKQQFDNSGNFSFGVAEYIEMANIKYDHEVGMMGFDVTVTLERPGYKVKKRKVKKGSVGHKHKIKPEEAMQWVKENFSVEIVS